MKVNNLRNLCLILVTAFAVSCANKQEDSKETKETSETEQNEWKEMDDFHMVMAETFHPYKDSANLEPVKTKAAELQASAEKWASATLPSKVDNDEMKGKLEQLKNESSALVQTISGGDDQAIADQLTKLHDLFHEIQEDWYGGHGEGHSHH